MSDIEHILNFKLKSMETKLVANLGGVFIHCEDPEKIAEWYKRNLGMNYEFAEEYGARFCLFYYLEEDTNRKAYLVFSYMKSEHPLPEKKSFTINLRVANLDKTIAHLKSNGVEVKEPMEYPQGKFAWLNDPEGTAIELWEDTTLI